MLLTSKIEFVFKIQFKCMQIYVHKEDFINKLYVLATSLKDKKNSKHIFKFTTLHRREKKLPIQFTNIVQTNEWERKKLCKSLKRCIAQYLRSLLKKRIWIIWPRRYDPTELAVYCCHSVYCCQIESIINMSFNTLSKCGTKSNKHTHARNAQNKCI